MKPGIELIERIERQIGCFRANSAFNIFKLTQPSEAVTFRAATGTGARSIAAVHLLGFFAIRRHYDWAILGFDSGIHGNTAVLSGSD